MEKKSKEVKMNVQEKQNPEKMSYEQLEQIAYNLNRQCQQLQAQIRSMQGVIDQFNEMDVLFNVLEKSEYFTGSFVTRCSTKVEELITKALDASEQQENSNNGNGEA